MFVSRAASASWVFWGSGGVARFSLFRLVGWFVCSLLARLVLPSSFARRWLARRCSSFPVLVRGPGTLACLGSWLSGATFDMVGGRDGRSPSSRSCCPLYVVDSAHVGMPPHLPFIDDFSTLSSTWWAGWHARSFLLSSSFLPADCSILSARVGMQPPLLWPLLLQSSRWFPRHGLGTLAFPHLSFHCFILSLSFALSKPSFAGSYIQAPSLGLGSLASLLDSLSFLSIHSDGVGLLDWFIVYSQHCVNVI